MKVLLKRIKKRPVSVAFLSLLFKPLADFSNKMIFRTRLLYITQKEVFGGSISAEIFEACLAHVISQQ